MRHHPTGYFTPCKVATLTEAGAIGIGVSSGSQITITVNGGPRHFNNVAAISGSSGGVQLASSTSAVSGKRNTISEVLVDGIAP